MSSGSVFVNCPLALCQWSDFDQSTDTGWIHLVSELFFNPTLTLFTKSFLVSGPLEEGVEGLVVQLHIVIQACVVGAYIMYIYKSGGDFWWGCF